MSRNRAITLAAALAAGAAGFAATESEDVFLDRFAGQWSGSGSVVRNFESGAHDVNCELTGSNGPGQVSIDGSCRAYLVFSRDIGARLQLDPATGTYRGTYVGSKVGPAALSGRRNGDALDLTVTWPEEVNGDRKANMQIVNAGDGRLRIVVTDQQDGSGPLHTTTDISLTRG